MVLSDRFGGKRQSSLGKRTAIYILGFALGSLAIAGLLSFVLVTVAESALPKPAPRAGTAAGPKGEVSLPLGTSKARTSRAKSPPRDSAKSRANERTETKP